MRNVLRPSHRALLKYFVSGRALLAFDYDGTLAPISDDREDVHMRAETIELLHQACQVFCCAVITGRSRADARARLAGVPIPHIIGNHGLEPSDEPPPFATWAVQTIDRLRTLLGAPGIDIEDKQYSVSIHYRHAPSPARALSAIMRAIDVLEERPRVVGGKMVVNLTPIDAPHKGTALSALADREAMTRIIYVGDDVTDEDVFAHASPEALLGVRVGHSTTSAARFYIPDQQHIDELVRRLIALRLEGAKDGG